MTDPAKPLNRTISSGVSASSSSSSLLLCVFASANAWSIASNSRNRSAIPIATSYVSAAPVTNAMRVAAPASTLTRRRKLKMGSSTGPVLPDKRDPKSNAAGLAGVRPRPRNLIRSVSYSISMAETVAAELCIAQIGRSFAPRGRRRAKSAPHR
jgi:hypothetical protein